MKPITGEWLIFAQKDLADDATGFYDFAKGVFEKVQDMLEQDAENDEGSVHK